MLATLWNWNHRFLGMNESGVYFAVLILFRGKLYMGWPSPSSSSLGRGRLKNRVRLLLSSCDSPESESSF